VREGSLLRVFNAGVLVGAGGPLADARGSEEGPGSYRPGVLLRFMPNTPLRASASTGTAFEQHQHGERSAYQRERGGLRDVAHLDRRDAREGPGVDVRP
jgi:hypothetical protein